MVGEMNMIKKPQPIGYAVFVKGAGYGHYMVCNTPELALHMAENFGPDVEIMVVSERITIHQLRDLVIAPTSGPNT